MDHLGRILQHRILFFLAVLSNICLHGTAWLSLGPAILTGTIHRISRFRFWFVLFGFMIFTLRHNARRLLSRFLPLGAGIALSTLLTRFFLVLWRNDNILLLVPDIDHMCVVIGFARLIRLRLSAVRRRKSVIGHPSCTEGLISSGQNQETFLCGEHVAERDGPTRAEESAVKLHCAKTDALGHVRVADVVEAVALAEPVLQGAPERRVHLEGGEETIKVGGEEEVDVAVPLHVAAGAHSDVPERVSHETRLVEGDVHVDVDLIAGAEDADDLRDRRPHLLLYETDDVDGRGQGGRRRRSRRGRWRLLVHNDHAGVIVVVVVTDELDLGDAEYAKEGDDAKVLAPVAGEDLYFGVLSEDGLLRVEHLNVAGVLGVKVAEQRPVLVVRV